MLYELPLVIKIVWLRRSEEYMHQYSKMGTFLYNEANLTKENKSWNEIFLQGIK